MTLTRPADDDLLVGSGHAPLPRVNLLPPEIGARRRLRKVQAALAGGVLASVGVVAVLYVGAVGAVGSAQEELSTATAAHAALQAETAQYRDVTAAYQRSADAQAMLVAAMGEEVRFSRFLRDMSLSVPDGVWLTSAAFVQTQGTPAAAAAAAAPATGTPAGIGTLTVSGVAYEHEDVALWLESLAAQDGYADPLLQSSTRTLIGPKKVVEWSTTVTLSPEALSGRYTTTGS